MADNLCSQTAVKSLLSHNSLFAKKKYGQNFLTDENILQKIVEAGEINKNDLIIEIGPGLGALTKALAQRAGQVVAVEIDSEIIPILTGNLCGCQNVTIINADFLKLSLPQLTQDKCCKVVANLPYYITTPIIFALLESGADIECIVVMVQKEVGERMAAKPSTKAYGALTLAIEYYSDVSIAANVPPHCFYPQPEVDSVVVKFNMLHRPRVNTDKEKLFGVIGAAFSTRRKTLLNCLSAAYGLPKETVRLAMSAAQIHENIRGEALTLEQFAALTEALFIQNSQ